MLSFQSQISRDTRREAKKWVESGGHDSFDTYIRGSGRYDKDNDGTDVTEGQKGCVQARCAPALDDDMTQTPSRRTAPTPMAPTPMPAPTTLLQLHSSTKPTDATPSIPMTVATMVLAGLKRVLGLGPRQRRL